MARVWESRLIFKDIQYGALKVDLADMEFSLPSVNESFTNEEKNVKVRNLILMSYYSYTRDSSVDSKTFLSKRYVPALVIERCEG